MYLIGYPALNIIFNAKTKHQQSILMTYLLPVTQSISEKSFPY